MSWAVRATNDSPVGPPDHLGIAQELNRSVYYDRGDAKTAGVSKATICRWWSSKAEIVDERHHVPTGQTIAEYLNHLGEQYAGWPGRIVAKILGEAQSDPSIG